MWMIPVQITLNVVLLISPLGVTVGVEYCSSTVRRYV